MTISSSQLDEYNAKGFTRVPGFLTSDEITFLRQDFERSTRIGFRFYGVKDVTPGGVQKMKARLLDVSRTVASATSTNTDMLSGAIYWASQRSKAGVTDGWHQDHDSWWLWGKDHVNYLHMYIPIIKPDANKTGLALAPLDRLRESSPDAYSLVAGKGAIGCKYKAGSTTVLLRDTGAKYKLDFDIEAIAEAPELAEGDLLLFRGDVLHRTQDRETDRLAVSFRMANTQSVVRREHMLEWGSLEKFVLVMTNHEKYQSVLAALDQYGDGCRLGQVQAYLDETYDRRPSKVAFAALLTAQVRAAGAGLVRGRRA